MSQNIGAVKNEGQTEVRLYLKTSTTGMRGIRVETAYSVTADEGVSCRSSINAVMNLETREPFTLDTSLLSLRLRPIQQACTDETFLLSPSLKALTPHVLEVVDSWTELRHPVRLEEETPSQLSGCILYESSVSRECYPLVVRKAELLSSLDVQEFSLGKYVVKWKREGSDTCTTTAFDLATVKVCLSTLYATATLPAFGVVRTPMTLEYTIFNRTDKVQEYALRYVP